MMKCLLVALPLLTASVPSWTDYVFAWKLDHQPGFARSEFDRIYKNDPIGVAYALYAATVEECQLTKLPARLDEVVRAMELERDVLARSIVISAVKHLGYPISGDRRGLCNKASKELRMIKKAAKYCLDMINRYKGTGVMFTCF